MRKVQFYYDVVSPYSWFAFEVFCRFKKTWDIDLELCPFFLGGVMQATGNTAPAMVPARALYLVKDLARQSDYFRLPLQIPANFPANSLNAMRLLHVVKQNNPNRLETLSRILWQRHYGKGQEIGSPESLKEACTQADLSHADTARCLELTQDQKTKDALKSTTLEAIEKGAFGAPTYFIETENGDEMFFGSDRFHLVAPLFGKKWVDPIP